MVLKDIVSRSFVRSLVAATLVSGCVAFNAQAQGVAEAPVKKAEVKTEKAAKPVAVVSPEHIEKYELQQYVESSARWGEEAARYQALNASEGGDDSILFLGSSSIRLWKSVEEDLGNSWKAVNRGYGGAKFCDAAIYTPNLVKGLKYQGAVVFVANDITGGKADKSPEEIARLAKCVVETIQAERPGVPVLLMSITATPSRFKAWPKIEEANFALSKLAESMDKVYFLDTKRSYLTDEGEPKPEYFVKDMLHQNAKGYKVWGKLVAEKLATIEELSPAK